MQESLFEDGKDPQAFRTIGEVSAALDIKPHVLRYWEEQFPMLRPVKRSGGRRYYRPGDVELLQTIDRLLNEQGYTIRGAVKALEEGEKAPLAPHVAQPGAAAEGGQSPVQIPEKSQPLRNHRDAALEPRLRAIRKKLAAALLG